MATEKKGITVRFEDSEIEALERIAKRFHVTSATIIRWALQALQDYVKANDGKIVLPLDFSSFFESSVKPESNKAPTKPAKKTGSIKTLPT